MPSPFVSRIHPRATAFALLLAAASAVGACSSDSSVESGSEAGADSGPDTAPKDASLGSDGATSDGAVDGGDGAVGDDDADADAALPFLNPHFAFSGPVNAFLHAGHSWYVGGNFTRISKYAASNLIALDPTGATAGCVSASGFDGEIDAIAQSGSSVYVGGMFTHYQGSSANFIAKLDAATCALDTSFSPSANNGFDDFVTSLVVTNGSLYVGGSFSEYRGASAINIAKLDLSTGALDTTFSPPANNGFDNEVNALAASGTSVYVGGAFTAYRGVSGSASKIAKLDATSGALDTTFSPPANNGFSDTIASLGAFGSSLYVGGYFSAYRGVAGSANRFAKLDLTSGALDTTFSPPAANGFDDVVLSIAFAGTSIYAGGRFTVYRGTTSVNSIAKLDLTTGAADTTFSPAAANGFNIEVDALAVSGTSIYVGGAFDSYRTTITANNFAKLDLTSGAMDTTFVPADGDTNGVAGGSGGTAILAAAIVGTNLWIGGRFSVYGGYATNYLAKLDEPDLTVDTTFSPAALNGFDEPVNALATSGSALYVGGSFSQYQEVVYVTNGLAKLDLTTGSLDATFSPSALTANGFDGTVNALAVSGTSLYAGGSFTSYRGATASAENLAKLDLTSGALDTTFSPAGATANGTDGAVASLVVAGSSLYLGGTFSAYRGVSGSSTNLAKVDLTSGALDTTFSPPGATSNGFDGAVSALTTDGTSLYIGGTFTAYRSVTASAENLAKLNLTSGALDTTFSPPGAASNGFDGSVDTLAFANGSLYVGGAFTAYRGVASSAEAIAKVNSTSGALDTTFSPPGATTNGFDSTVTALGVSSTTLLCGGSFTAYRGVAASAEAFAVLDPATGSVR